MPRRQNEDYLASGLADYDFYLSWSPLQPQIIRNPGACKRYWEARRTDADAEQAGNKEKFDDERIDKVANVLSESHLTCLSAMLYSSAIDFEYTVFLEKEKNVMRPLLQYRCVEEVCVNASEWFRCFAVLPYDATFRLEALLDCLEFLMGMRYGKF
jgi:hypothetical protein